VERGDRWEATAEAAAELTGIDPIQSGGLRCSLREIKPSGGAGVVRVAIGGTIAGPSDHGPSRQTLDGYYLFDLEQGRVTRLVLEGRSEILGESGEPIGAVQARYQLDRRPSDPDPKLTDAALAGAR